MWTVHVLHWVSHSLRASKGRGLLTPVPICHVYHGAGIAPSELSSERLNVVQRKLALDVFLDADGDLNLMGH